MTRSNEAARVVSRQRRREANSTTTPKEEEEEEEEELLSSLCPLGQCFCKFWEPAQPTGGGGRQYDLKKEEAKQPRPQGRRGKAAPLKGRRDHH